jgi:TIR domain
MTREKVFISYSHKDAKWLDRVREQLAVLERERLIEVFEDTLIGAGEEWYPRLNQEMLKARLSLLLISPSFLTSVFISEQEVPRLFGRHEADGMVLHRYLFATVRGRRCHG